METQVLIVGAGPTGLMMACQLQRWGVDFVIIDDKDTVTDKSKALAVQARSLEIFRQMGIADKAVKNGAQAKALNLVVKDKVRGHIAFGNIGEGLSPFPYILMLEQNKNEELLEEYITKNEGRVLWKHELASFIDGNDGIRAKVKNGNGEEIEIRARYMVGADGAKSPVRHILDLPFTGSTYENVFFVADTKVQWKMDPDELYVIMSLKTFSAFFPMNGENRFRVVGTMPEKFTDDGSVTFEDIEDTVRSQMDVPVTFSDTSWFSIYRVHHRVASSFRKGNVFLAGDAAHVHSPVGAQGMNTGLQDAYNLAWKMAWTLKGISDARLLDTYNDERHRIATILVQTTDRVFGIVIDPGFWARIFKFHILPVIAPVLMRITVFKRKMYKLASQIAVKYPRSSVSIGKVGKIEAGSRFPYFKLLTADGTYMESFDLFTQCGLYIITYNVVSDMRLPADLDIYGYDIPGNDTNKHILSKLGFGGSFICIVRPDTYIGYISDRCSEPEIKAYLREHLYLKPEL